MNPEYLKYAEIRQEIAEKYAIRMGDILIVRGNANPDLVGKAGRVEAFPAGCIYPDITKRVLLKTDGGCRLLPEFAILVWNHSIVHNQILRRAKTSNGTLKINNRDVKNIIVPVPPMEEQQNVVGVLSAVESKVDAVTRIEAALTVLKKSLMHDLLTGAVRITARDLPPPP